MTALHLGAGIRPDADYLGGGAIALLAKRGAGKTYLGRVMAEEFWGAGVQFVALDPMGAWWGLRSSADGKGEGLPVVIVGGEHGDVPLERKGGDLLADLVVDEGLSMVLDMSLLGSRAAEREFGYAFLERLYRRNKASGRLVHILMDEADLFAPQKPQSGDQPLLGITENIVRRGRNAGIGITLITQRSAVLNKDVLTQVDAIAAGRVLSPQDREAIDAWTKVYGDPAEAAKVRETLHELDTGEWWWWVPELGILKRGQIRQARTYDSSPTRKRGAKRALPKTYADVDLGALQERMAATIERAKAKDPTELRKQVAQMRRELAQRPTETVKETVTETVEVPVLDDAHVERLEDAVELLSGAAAKIITAANDISGGLGKLRTRAPAAPPARAPAQRQPPPPARRAPARRAVAPAPPVDGEFALTGPHQRVLDAMAWLEAVGFPQPTKIQVGFIAGYRVGKKVGGTFGNILGQLRSAGLIDYPAQGDAVLTDPGRALAEIPDIEQTTEGLQAAIYARLNEQERRVLEGIVESYPDAIAKQEAGERAGCTVGEKVGGTFGNILGRLRSLGLVDYPTQGYVAAEPVLFLEAA
jgi:hypothetical protein